MRKRYVYSGCIVIAAVALFVTIHWVELGKNDIDGDGVLNTEDACPEMFGPVHYLGCDVIEKAGHEGITYYTIDHVEEINRNLRSVYHAPFLWDATPPCPPSPFVCFDVMHLAPGWEEEHFLSMIKVI